MRWLAAAVVVVAGGRHARRFDCGRDDVKNNERGRGQERGCDPTLTRNGASLLSLYSARLYSMSGIALIRRVCAPSAWSFCAPSAAVLKKPRILYPPLTVTDRPPDKWKKILLTPRYCIIK